MNNVVGGSVVWDLNINDKGFTKGLQGAKDAVNKAAQDVDGVVSNLSQSVSSAFKRAEDSSLKFATGLGAVTAGLVGAIGFGVKVAADVETARQGFVTLLGSVEAADAAINQIRRDAAQTPFEFSGLVRANQLLTQVTKDSDRSEKLLLNVGKALSAAGKSGAELDNVIVNLQGIANTASISALDIKQFGFAGINILELLADQYGVTKEAAAEMVKESDDAFGDLEKAFEKAGTGSGKFARAFVDQAGTFNQLRSNFSDVTSQIAADIVVQTGIFDAVKKAFSGLIDTLQRLQPSIVQGIKDFMQFIVDNGPVVAGIILGGLAPAFAGLATAIGTAVINLAPFIAAGVLIAIAVKGIVDSLGGWQATQEKLNGVLSNLADIFNTYIRPAFEDLWSAIRDNLVPVLKDLWDAVGPILGPVLEALAKILGGALLVAIVAITKGITIMVNQFADGARNFGNTVTAIKDFVSSIPGAIDNFARGVQDSAQNISKFFTETIPNAISNLPNAIKTSLKESILSFVDFIGYVTGLVVYGIPKIVESVKIGIEQMGTDITNFFNALPQRIADTFMSVVESVRVGMSNARNDASNGANNIVESISSFFNTLPARASEAFGRTADTIIQRLREAFESAQAEVSTWPDRFRQWGRTVVTSFAQGIRDAVDSIVDAFRQGLDRARRVIEGHSPPKEGPFKNIDKWGFNVGQAWVDGMTEAINGVDLSSPTLQMAKLPARPENTSTQRGSGITINIDQMNVRDEGDIRRVSEELGFRIDMSPTFIG